MLFNDAVNCLIYVAPVIDRGTSVEHWRNDIEKGKWGTETGRSVPLWGCPPKIQPVVVWIQPVPQCLTVPWHGLRMRMFFAFSRIALTTVALLILSTDCAHGCRPGVISCFRLEVDENCALRNYYAASSGNLLPTFFGDSLAVRSSEFNTVPKRR
jgi:hypothetical protein